MIALTRALVGASVLHGTTVLLGASVLRGASALRLARTLLGASVLHGTSVLLGTSYLLLGTRALLCAGCLGSFGRLRLLGCLGGFGSFGLFNYLRCFGCFRCLGYFRCFGCFWCFGRFGSLRRIRLDTDRCRTRGIFVKVFDLVLAGEGVHEDFKFLGIYGCTRFLFNIQRLKGVDNILGFQGEIVGDLFNLNLRHLSYRCPFRKLPFGALFSLASVGWL